MTSVLTLNTMIFLFQNLVLHDGEDALSLRQEVRRMYLSLQSRPSLKKPGIAEGGVLTWGVPPVPKAGQDGVAGLRDHQGDRLFFRGQSIQVSHSGRGQRRGQHGGTADGAG